MIQNKALKERLLEKIADLPESKLKEVIDFVDLVKNRSNEGEDPILKVIGCLSGKPLSAEEIEEELYGRN